MQVWIRLAANKVGYSWHHPSIKWIKHYLPKCTRIYSQLQQRNEWPHGEQRCLGGREYFFSPFLITHIDYFLYCCLSIHFMPAKTTLCTPHGWESSSTLILTAESSFEVHHFPRANFFHISFIELLLRCLPALLKKTIQNNYADLSQKTCLTLSQEDASLIFHMLCLLLWKMLIVWFRVFLIVKAIVIYFASHKKLSQRNVIERWGSKS